MGGVSVKSVRKSYGALEVIHQISFDIQNGEFIVLVGPSGCGKSTLLRMIAGLEEISGGEISIAGKVINDLPPKARDIAMVFQNYALYPHMTVEQNMGFSLRLAKRPKAEIAGAVQTAAESLGLKDLLPRFPRQLSGGQRQRVAMGRALVRNPSVFLFDEPLSNLDAKLRVQMRAEIKALQQRLGTTTVYVTHDQIEAMTMADRIVVMRDGVIEQMGTPLELYDRPANLFVASFIGSPAMNLLEGTGVADGFVTGAGHRLPVPFGAEAAKTYGIRPEHFSLHTDGLPLEVVVVEPTGSETQITGKLGKELITVALRDRVTTKPGEIIRLKPEVSAVHLFDQFGNRVEV